MKKEASSPTLTYEQALEACLEGLEQLFRVRLLQLKGEEADSQPTFSLEALGRVFLPHLQRDQFHVLEGLLLTLALFPHVRPQLVDRIFQEIFPKGGDFPELGGIRGKNHRGFLPTGTTALYLLAGDDLGQRLALQNLLDSEHWFAKEQVLTLAPTEKHEPYLSGQLVLDPELVEKLTLGKVGRPRFGAEFPAVFVETEMKWEDLVLPIQTQTHIQDLLIWLKHHQTLRGDWQMGHKIKPGYRVLFCGPPGTGKTLTATLLGKYTQRDVYKVDLSTIVSKYIGETEKNLANLFDRAENKQWILFFDEADALFGKRTQVQNAHDRFANQEVSYLLQRIESFNGLVILASNFKSNIDDAFLRRFQAIVPFPMPKPHERHILWEKSLPKQLPVAPEIDLKQIAQKYELSGADIMNVVQYVSLQALEGQQDSLSKELLMSGIKQELVKGNKII